jgi:hypothetical protein
MADGLWLMVDNGVTAFGSRARVSEVSGGCGMYGDVIVMRVVIGEEIIE